MMSKGKWLALAAVMVVALMVSTGVVSTAAFGINSEDIKNKLILDTVAEPDEGFAPLKVTFSVTPDEPLKNPRYTWDFADGSDESHEAKPTHVFKKAGLFKVTVKLRYHGTEKRGEDFVYVDVEEPETPPEAPKKKTTQEK